MVQVGWLTDNMYRRQEGADGSGDDIQPNAELEKGLPSLEEKDEKSHVADKAGTKQACMSGPPTSDSGSGKHHPLRPAPALQPHNQSQYLSKSSPPSLNRVASPGGGVQVTLDGGGSWSELARQDTTLPREANAAEDGKPEGSGGMFGFLKGKRGRTNSPRPRERGVLGKEGARVIIS